MIHFHILSIFPEALEAYLNVSIIGKAIERGLIQVSYHQLRDFTLDVHRRVDGRPYGGGPGMIFKPDVVVRAVTMLKEQYSIERVLLMSPRGPLLKHDAVRRLAEYKSLLLLCGRYEGVDQRAIDLVVDEELSIGDYVLTGGELAAQVVVDAVARHVPGVIGDAGAAMSDSHANGLLEYPQYTRPDVFEGLSVPDVLLKGHHAAIEQWREKESMKLTKKVRPDLLVGVKKKG